MLWRAVERVIPDVRQRAEIALVRLCCLEACMLSAGLCLILMQNLPAYLETSLETYGLGVRYWCCGMRTSVIPDGRQHAEIALIWLC